MVNVWVENHTPVPLRPLAEVLAGAGPLTPVYVGRAVFRDGPTRRSEFTTGGYVGWFFPSDGQDQFREAGGGNGNDHYWYADGMDLDESLGRLLQPGEVLHITHAADRTK